MKKLRSEKLRADFPFPKNLCILAGCVVRGAGTSLTIVI